MNKLSELLESGAEALALDAAENKACGAFTISKVCSVEASALRAIAPALVEVVRNSARTCSCAFGCPDCPHCQLEAAMKAAGVTCE